MKVGQRRSGPSPCAVSQPPAQIAPLLIDSTLPPGPQTEKQTRLRSCMRSSTSPSLRSDPFRSEGASHMCPASGHALGSPWARSRGITWEPVGNADCLRTPLTQVLCVPRWMADVLWALPKAEARRKHISKKDKWSPVHPSSGSQSRNVSDSQQTKSRSRRV